MSAIETCRTAALGGHVERCEDCGHNRIAYNSCRNRHCPKCQGAAARHGSPSARPSCCRSPTSTSSSPCRPRSAPIAFQNKAVVYDLLFRTAAETLLTIAADPKHLGARIGLTAVLHTWGSALTHHPHVHIIVPGGGLSLDGSRWIACKPGFFLPVRVLSRLFRRLFLEGLAALHAAGRLVFFGELARPRRQERLRRRASRRCAAPSGSSTPSGRSPGQRRCSPISPATPTASPSRTRRLIALDDERRHLPVEGLSGRRPRPVQDHDARGRRVHPPLPAARAAEWLPPHPPLRPASPARSEPATSSASAKRSPRPRLHQRARTPRPSARPKPFPRRAAAPAAAAG